MTPNDERDAGGFLLPLNHPFASTRYELELEESERRCRDAQATLARAEAAQAELSSKARLADEATAAANALVDAADAEKAASAARLAKLQSDFEVVHSFLHSFIHSFIRSEKKKNCSVFNSP